MNKPTFQAIRTHSPTKPTLVFVASRRQTRLTALDLISYVSAEENPKQWLSMPENDVDDIIATLHDENLKLVLSFGIGMHHAGSLYDFINFYSTLYSLGLHEKDRKIVEELFLNRKIQVLVATSKNFFPLVNLLNIDIRHTGLGCKHASPSCCNQGN